MGYAEVVGGSTDFSGRDKELQPREPDALVDDAQSSVTRRLVRAQIGRGKRPV
jgi:hypothetical protein